MEFLHDEIRERYVDGHFGLRGIQVQLVALELVVGEQRHIPDSQT